MRLASLRRGGRDGTLALVSADGSRAYTEPAGYPTLQAALDDWDRAFPLLRDTFGAAGEAVGPADFHAPLPRAYHWADGSTYLAHMERIRAARGMALPPGHDTEPIAYQSGSDANLPPTAPLPLPDEAWQLDLEATVCVVTGDVPRGVEPDDVPRHIRLVLLANDLTYRAIMPLEYVKQVGPYRAKPARPYAPFARTAATLAEWDGRLLHATIRCTVRGEVIGELRPDEDCAFDFGVLIAYLCQTRGLAAGSIVGSGTVSNRAESRGFGALAELRAVRGHDAAPWLAPGDTVRVEAFGDEGESLFGAIDNTVAAA